MNAYSNPTMPSQRQGGTCVVTVNPSTTIGIHAALAHSQHDAIVQAYCSNMRPASRPKRPHRFQVTSPESYNTPAAPPSAHP
jgi:hypothetical protein